MKLFFLSLPVVTNWDILEAAPSLLLVLLCDCRSIDYLCGGGPCNLAVSMTPCLYLVFQHDYIIISISDIVPLPLLKGTANSYHEISLTNQGSSIYSGAFNRNKR